MKKYGDDADSFYDQGTRVEESAKWHRQHNVGPIYPHSRQPNPRHYNKPIHRHSRSNKSRNSNNFKVNDSPYWEKYYSSLIICTKCGKKYNNKLNSYCPYCKKNNNRYKSKSSNKSSNKSSYMSTNSYKQEYNSKSESKSYGPNIVTCPKCGRKKPKGKPCSYCNHIIVCPYCGKNYNKKHKGELVMSCPHCRRPGPIKQTYKSEHEPLEIGICRRCGHEYDSSLRQCPNCGSKYIVLNMATCNNCGYKYDKNKFDSCPKCKSSTSNADLWIEIIIIFIIFIILVVLGGIIIFH